MKKQKFSIIIPAHNEEDVIKRAIKSVQNQTFKDFEIIIVNDGSTDRTRQVVGKMMKQDKRIKLINFKRGHSAAFARNRGAETAKGDIFVFLDADTTINKIFIEELVKKYGKADAFITLNYPLRDKLISKILSGFLGKPFKEKLKDGTVYNKSNNQEAGSMFFCYTKKAYKKIGGYVEDIFYYEDEKLVNRFYGLGMESIFVKKAHQYYELPSTFREFLRQCTWLGKGINTIKEKRKRRTHKTIWFVKSLFLLFPLAFSWNLNYFWAIFATTIVISYLGILKRNRAPILSLMVLPFFYIKTLFVSFNIIKFWK